jgi:hypothetical protein
MVINESAISDRLADMLIDAVQQNGYEGDQVYVKCKPGGTVTSVFFGDNLGEYLASCIGHEYCDRVIGFEPIPGARSAYDYKPVFDDETQRKWDEAQDRYDSGAAAYYASKGSGGYTGD